MADLNLVNKNIHEKNIYDKRIFLYAILFFLIPMRQFGSVSRHFYNWWALGPNNLFFAAAINSLNTLV